MCFISKSYLYILIISMSGTLCRSSQILVVFWMPGVSHGILGNTCVDLLLEAGHQVTYLSWGPRSVTSHQNLTFIDISYPLSIDEKFNLKMVLNKEINLLDLRMISTVVSVLQRKVLELEQVQSLLNDPNEKYDVAILEWLYAEYIAGMAAVFGCPYIWFSTMEPHSMILSLIGGVTNPAYVSMNNFDAIPPFTFMQRVQSLKDQLFMGLFRQLQILPNEDHDFGRVIAPIIAKRHNVVPSYNEVRYNASLILGNSHVSAGKSIQVPETYKAIGGYHVKKNTKQLPKALKALMDNSTNGVIYFSMGSKLKSKDFPDEMILEIINLFGELKQTVIWKFETDLPNTANNVHVIPWSPQQSVLAHPNCVLFISHGGQLSVLEALHFGVPLIGIPVFADQIINVKTLAKKGMAKEVNLSYNLGLDLKVAIEEILGNSSYANAAKHQSFIYHHRTVPPEIELVHWVEHVIQTQGAPHLRSITIPWYQMCYLDVTAVAIVLFVLLMQMMKLFLLAIKYIQLKPLNAKKIH